jgi:magnesium chelatase subunit I
MRPYSSLIRHQGNKELFLYLEMSIISQLNGFPLHFHVEGLRGTGKTTIIRSARNVLPPITRIKGCLYNCAPTNPHCPDHRGLAATDIIQLGTEEIPMPFLEISASAKVGTVVGTIDLGKITNSTQPEAALLPGTVPQAHRGIVFVDEINRLADTSPELVDILLDVMGTKPGRLQIEESGLPRIELPAQVAVWAASNPDEDPGSLEDIRRQLSDRFDFLVEMARPSKPDIVAQVLGQSYGRVQAEFCLQAEDCQVQQKLISFSSFVRQVEVDNPVREVLASLYTKFNLESLRAVEALQYGSKIYAAQRGKCLVTVEDLAVIAPAVLRHRVEPGRLTEIITYLENIATVGEGSYVTVAASVNTETDKSPAPIKGNDRPLGIWHKLCAGIRRLIPQSFNQRLGRHSQAGSGMGRGIARQQGDQAGEPGTGNKQPLVSDPTKTPILSPPRQARPLYELAAEGNVFPGEKEDINVADS